MKQDKITIHGPKIDGTYIVEFKTADGVALAFSVPKGGGTAVLEYFQDKMPYGLAVPDFKSPLLAKSPLASARPATGTRGRDLSSAAGLVTTNAVALRVVRTASQFALHQIQ